MDRLKHKMMQVKGACMAVRLCQKQLERARMEMQDAKNALADELLAENDLGDRVHGGISLDQPIIHEDYMFTLDEEMVEDAQDAGARKYGHCLIARSVTQI